MSFSEQNIFQFNEHLMLFQLVVLCVCINKNLPEKREKKRLKTKYFFLKEEISVFHEICILRS